MFVQAFLLHRKGLGNFDPLSDWLHAFHGDPENAYFYTWCKQGETIPRSCTPAGVFLGDHFGNFIFEGIRNFGELGYVKSVIPKLEQGYIHSSYHRLFAPPADTHDLIDKLTSINKAYFAARDDFAATPAYSNGMGFSWELDERAGITELRCPEASDGASLGANFIEIVKAINPCRKPTLVFRPIAT